MEDLGIHIPMNRHPAGGLRPGGGRRSVAPTTPKVAGRNRIVTSPEPDALPPGGVLVAQSRPERLSMNVWRCQVRCRASSGALGWASSIRSRTTSFTFSVDIKNRMVISLLMSERSMNAGTRRQLSPVSAVFVTVILIVQALQWIVRPHPPGSLAAPHSNTSPASLPSIAGKSLESCCNPSVFAPTTRHSASRTYIGPGKVSRKSISGCPRPFNKVGKQTEHTPWLMGVGSSSVVSTLPR